MPPQNETLSNGESRRLSISDVISAMKSNPEGYQCQMDACMIMRTFTDDDTVEVLMKKQEAISRMIVAMTTFIDKQELVREACQSIVALSSNSDVSCIQICRAKGLPVLIDIIRKYTDDTILLLMVLEILANISLTEELSEEIVKHAGHSEILATMSRNQGEYRVAKFCCFILGNLVHTVEVAQSIMFVGGVHSIIGALRRFPTNAEVLENGCRALGCFSAHDEICMDVANAGAVEAVLVAMTASQGVATLQECGCWALACLTKFEESCFNFCKAKGIQTLVKTLEKFRDEEALLEYACWTISNVAAHGKTLDRMTDPEVLSVVMDAMCRFPDNLEMQQQIFFAIGQIVMTSGERQDQLVKSGGVRAAVNIMTSFPDSQELQEHGCRIIGNVSVNESLRKLIESDGGSKAVIAAMLTHDRHEQIQIYGCMALTNITADVPENKGNVIKNAGVLAVLAALKEWMTDSQMVLCGLKTLGNLLEVEHAIYYFMEDGGLDTMRSILRDHRASLEIQKFVSLVLSNLSLAPGLNEDDLEVTEDMLYKMLARYPGDRDLHLCVCHYYENLVHTENGRSRFEKLRQMDKLLDCMNFFRNDKSIQISGCKIIAALAMYKKNSWNDGQLLVSRILEVMKTFPNCSSVQTICCGAISYLAEHNDSLRDDILKKGGLDIVMCTLREHPADEGLAVVGLMALDKITNKDVSDSHSVRHEITFIGQAMRHYPDNTELQIYACNILSAALTEGECDCSRTEARELVTNTLKRRRTNPELESSALEALTILLDGEDYDIIEDTKKKLPFLDDDFWNKFDQTVLHID